MEKMNTTQLTNQTSLPSLQKILAHQRSMEKFFRLLEECLSDISEIFDSCEKIQHQMVQFQKELAYIDVDEPICALRQFKQQYPTATLEQKVHFFNLWLCQHYQLNVLPTHVNLEYLVSAIQQWEQADTNDACIYTSDYSILEQICCIMEGLDWHGMNEKRKDLINQWGKKMNKKYQEFNSETKQHVEITLNAKGKARDVSVWAELPIFKRIDLGTKWNDPIFAESQENMWRVFDGLCHQASIYNAVSDPIFDKIGHMSADMFNRIQQGNLGVDLENFNSQKINELIGNVRQQVNPQEVSNLATNLQNVLNNSSLTDVPQLLNNFGANQALQQLHPGLPNVVNELFKEETLNTIKQNFGDFISQFQQVNSSSNNQ